MVAAVSAQTLRPGNDPRNQAPTVGTGGSPGGPTGLFTIYDGDTLRRGEFTFSIAYSNYDRDPGNVDITVVPLSFNVGINDHVELFFSTEGYRGVKVNNPKNLSGFYLPNSQLFFGATLLGSGPAIILAPERVSGPTVGNGAVFRPAFNQPFVQFPFVGGRGPNLGLTGNAIAPPFVSRLGTPQAQSDSRFGAAANFPGIGSPCGSILPGVVLTTRTIPANSTFNTLTVPDLFTICPTYIADAPFINRLYGQSAFGTFQAGAKIRFTGPTNPLGVGLVAFYRWYGDKADDFKGFNQLQRGASPGGNFGDIGVIGTVSGRLSRSANLSANIGYILNSNPQSKAFGGTGKVSLLDRPDELIMGVGFDFPINRHFQPIAELKSINYVGGRTPNAFRQNPLDFLGGVRVFPRRWFGFSAWWRENLNQQGKRLFHTQTFPAGFQQSDNPHGFGFQAFVGHRNERAPAVLPNQPPVISSFTASTATITLPCREGYTSSNCPTTANTGVTLTTTASDPDGDTLLYTYTVTGGKISGDGPNVSWDLSGVGPGTYTASVEVDDGCGCITMSSTTVTVANCPDCVRPVLCPTVNVSCPDSAQPGPVTFTANVSGGPGTQTYNWSVSAGTITTGQGTSSITVDARGGQTITATVELGGLDPNCGRTASCTTQIATPPAVARKFDEYGNIRFNDEKARLDNYAVQLQNEPGATGYIIGYGSCGSEGRERAERAKNYLVNTRGIDAGRIMVVDGGCLPELLVQLWIAPQGAAAPAGDATGVVSPCPDCKKKPTHRRRGGRRGEEE
ncbi:MAG: hypothetical protein DMF71_16580 [Acidobacteria bacterium]|nr:MAG: hypothetical protein DMF71_16580 [Acidobacteriota bacterium]